MRPDIYGGLEIMRHASEVFHWQRHTEVRENLNSVAMADSLNFSAESQLGYPDQKAILTSAVGTALTEPRPSVSLTSFSSRNRRSTGLLRW